MDLPEVCFYDLCVLRHIKCGIGERELSGTRDPRFRDKAAINKCVSYAV